MTAPEFVSAVRWLLANGWVREDYGSLLDSTGDVSLFWDWEKPGSAAALVAPPGATWVLEVSRRDGDKWRDDLTCRPTSVGQALGHLIAEGVLPAEMAGVR